MIRSKLTFYEVYSHFQSIRILITVVQYERSDFKLGPLFIDLIQGIEHRLYGLYTTLSHNRTASELGILTRMDHHQSTEEQIALDHGLFFHGPYKLFRRKSGMPHMTHTHFRKWRLRHSPKPSCVIETHRKRRPQHNYNYGCIKYDSHFEF